MQSLGPTTPGARRHAPGLGCSPVARHYWGNHSLFSSPGGTKMFQFPPLASMSTWISTLQVLGLSHSETRGSKVICTYPRLIAAYRVLHRLSEPRHPPCALTYFPVRQSAENRGRSYFQLYRHHPAPPWRSRGSLELFTLQFSLVSICQRSVPQKGGVVENNGFEPLTPCLQSRCSSQLS